MNKKLTIKRIVIYTVLAVVLTTVWGLLFLYLPDAPNMYDDPENASPYSSMAGFAMFGPAAAVFLTRLITKEGMENSMLKFNIRGNIKYYVLPFTVLLIAALINAVFLPICLGEKLYFGNDPKEYLLVCLNVIFTCVILCGLYFGEEYGWRGYLYPKLEELLGTWKALIVSSVIWGVWHTVFLLKGHNFGTDIPFFPVSNILLMCVMCIFIAPIFTFCSKKANSVWPAVLAHGFFNNFFTVCSTLFLDAQNTKMTTFQGGTFIMIGVGVVGTVFFILMVRDSKKSA